MVSKLKRTGTVIAGAIIGLVDGIVTSVSQCRFNIGYTLKSVAVNIIAALIGGAGIGSKYFQKSLFTRGGVYCYGKYYSSRALLLRQPAVLRDFGNALVSYCLGNVVSLVSKLT